MSGSAGRRVFLRVRGAHNVKAISRKVVWSSGGMTSTTGRRSTKPGRSVPFHMGSEKVTERRAQWRLVDLRAALDKGLSGATEPLLGGGSQFLGVLPASLDHEVGPAIALRLDRRSGLIGCGPDLRSLTGLLPTATTS